MRELAVVGATGAVGRVLLEEIAANPLFPAPRCFASERSLGRSLQFRDSNIGVEQFSISSVPERAFVLMSAGAEFSRLHSKSLVEKGCIVIDNSSAWRESEPLLVPEVNLKVVGAEFEKGIIANPNCSTIPLVVALEPLHRVFGLKRVDVSTYQSVSGAGEKGLLTLRLQEQGERSLGAFPNTIFHNVIPAIDVIEPSGHCREELKVMRETRKILDLAELEIFVHTVRVPVPICHGEAVTVELNQECSVENVRTIWNSTRGINLHGVDYVDLPSNASVTGDSMVHIARVRLGHLTKTHSRLLQFWIISDNLRKGAASNAVQILNILWNRDRH